MSKNSLINLWLVVCSFCLLSACGNGSAHYVSGKASGTCKDGKTHYCEIQNDRCWPAIGFDPTPDPPCLPLLINEDPPTSGSSWCQDICDLMQTCERGVIATALVVNNEVQDAPTAFCEVIAREISNSEVGIPHDIVDNVSDSDDEILRERRAPGN